MNLRILIADDHTLMRHGARAFLQSHRGWKVIGEAANGREAVQKVKKLRPDVAILDISMPELDGLEATRQIRATCPDIKILVLSMHESDQMVRRVFQAGAQGYVLKSDLGQCLVKAVKSVLQGQRFVTTGVSDILVRGPLKVEQAAEDSHTQSTPRELEIIRLVTEGKANKEIAAMLGIAVRTVETHRANIMHKLRLHSSADLVRHAIRLGLLPS